MTIYEFKVACRMYYAGKNVRVTREGSAFKDSPTGNVMRSFIDHGTVVAVNGHCFTVNWETSGQRSVSQFEDLALEVEPHRSKLLDTDPMPFGVHKGTAMANVPAYYLIWLYRNDKCSAQVKHYIEQNFEVLSAENEKIMARRDKSHNR